MSRNLLVLVFGAVTLLPVNQAFSGWMIAGSECRLSFNSTGRVNYLDGEIFSASSTTSFVDCPALTAPLEAIRIHYVDSSAAGNFRCYGYFRRLNGEFAATDSLFSCSIAGGCTTNSQPTFASSTQRVLDFKAFRGFSGVTCELPPGGSIRLVEIFQ